MDINTILSRSQHRVIQFACRIALKPDLNKKERESLKNLLQQSDAELFQLIEEVKGAQGQQKPLFVMSRQYSVGALLATAPSFLFATDSITISQVVRIGSMKTSGDNSLQNSILNKKMRDLFVKVPEVVKGLRYTRAGKIFEFNFGPFAPEEKSEIFKGLIPTPVDVVALNSQVTRIMRPTTEDMNIHTLVQFAQDDQRQPFLLQVKVDINNRNHKNNLDHRDIDQVFSDADSAVNDHLQWVFGAAS